MRWDEIREISLDNKAQHKTEGQNVTESFVSPEKSRARNFKYCEERVYANTYDNCGDTLIILP